MIIGIENLVYKPIPSPSTLQSSPLTLGGPSPLLKEQASSIFHSILGKGFPGSILTYPLTYTLQVISTLLGLLQLVKVRKEKGDLVLVTVG